MSSAIRDLGTRLHVRTYRRADQHAVARLYTQGLLAGQIAPNDTGADIENIDEAYFKDPASHFWVAEVDGHVRGMVAVARDEKESAEIRRLRVEKEFQDTNIAAKLIETAIAYCKKHGYLKVVLNSRFERGAVLDIFTRSGFLHTRSKEIHGREMLEFYIDLYQRPQSKHEA